MSAVVEAALAVLGLYVVAGFCFAIPFVLSGAARVVPAAKGGSWGFRLIIVPGVIGLWPLLAWRWMSGHRAIERNAHRDLAREVKP